MIQSTVTGSLENVVLAKSSSRPKSTYKAVASLTEFELKKILLDKMQKSTKSQLKSSSKSAQAEESVFKTADTDMPQNQGSDLAIDFKQPQTWISRTAQAEKPPLTFDELMSTPIDFKHISRVELEYHFEEFYKAVTDRLDWNNPEGQEYPFDLSKPLSLIEDRGRQVVLVNYFINNDLEYLKDMDTCPS
nr:hypothetical protein [Tanacetum cinerariifolium]